MKQAIKGFGEIPSAIKLGQWRRVNSKAKQDHELLSELAQLSREKTWLNKEIVNWQERINRINKRLSDIGDLEKTLIQKQMALKEQLSIKEEKDNQPSVKQTLKEAHEMIIKY
jgi:predicted  nucleic acid-binding Zn-ribbon protein